MAKVPIHHLPLPSRTLQSSLSKLELDGSAVSQRRSTTFNPATRGVWARVYPLWTTWPLRITKEELLEMGVDVDKGEQVSVEDVLMRWDVKEGTTEQGTSGLGIGSSEHRLKLEPKLLGIASSTIRDSLPHLDVGDSNELCNESTSSGSAENEARDSLVDILSGRKILQSTEDDGKTYGPWSTRYCGHQFGSWAGQLGDGRAISLLETDSSEGGRQEIQIKGGGRTPFSRSADGLAVLRSGVREYLGCEAVGALGIPTTRSLALLTHDPSISVMRENGPEPPSLLARVAPSFIRIGHFEALNPGRAGHMTHQYFLGNSGWQQDEATSEEKGPLGSQGNLEGLRELTDWCRTIMGSEGGVKEWVKEVIRRNAEMVAGWQVYGYMHGVLNTDNISILGLTIDYGPFAFMDVWDEQHICNHSDPSGLYSYKAQPSRVLWDLNKLVHAVSPLIGYESLEGYPTPGFADEATKDDVEEWSEKGLEVMQGFEEEYFKVERQAEQEGWIKRFGLKTFSNADNRDVIYDFLTHLHTHRIDFHTSLRHLSTFRPSSASDPESITSFTETMLRASLSNPSEEQVREARKDFEPYLLRYATRVQQPEEISAWESTSVLQNDRGVDLTGDGWEEKRRTDMLRSNPKFVLRQWVLEELIAKLEKSNVERIEDGRKDLAKILDMSTRPFIDWDQVGPEEKRLCGLGAKDMLGFQCSCSS